MKTLVIGGTGLVGSQVVKELLARKVDVRVLVHSPEKLKTLPAGVEGVVGDLNHLHTLGPAFKGVDKVFLLVIGDLSECFQGLFAIEAARISGVKHIVYLSVFDSEKGVHIPQFGSKVAIERALKASGIPYTILSPSNFFQNDIWLKDALIQYNTYPWPYGVTGMSRVDVRDIAEAAAITLTTEGHVGKTYPIVGANLTGPQIAESWGNAFGKTISYMGDDLDEWEKMFVQYMPAWQVSAFKIMNDHFIQKGFLAKPADIDQTTKLLGHPPRNFDDFTKEMAKTWTA